MLGYGFVNSFVQKYALENIIGDFFTRLNRYNGTLFIGVISYINKNKADYASIPFFLQKIENLQEIEEEINKLLNIFIEEEKDNIYTYILSANVAIDKDYDFIKKTLSECLEDGKQNLKSIFEQVLFDFLQKYSEHLESLNIDLSLSLGYSIDASLSLGYRWISGSASGSAEIEKIFNTSSSLEKDKYSPKNINNYFYRILENYPYYYITSSITAIRENEEGRPVEVTSTTVSSSYFYNNFNFEIRNNYLNILNNQLNSLNSEV